MSKVSQRGALLLGIFIASNLPLLAEDYCPTSADLEQGIVFVQKLRNYDILHQHQKSTETEYWQSWTNPYTSSESQWHSRTFMGLLVQDRRRGRGGVSEKLEYKYDLAKLFPLKNGSTHKFNAIRTSGKIKVDLEYTLNVVGDGKYSIGSCEFDTKVVAVTEYNKIHGKVRKGPFNYEWQYAPELAYVVSKKKFSSVRVRNGDDKFLD